MHYYLFNISLLYFLNFFTDYTLTDQDECAHFVIEDSLEEEILVQIDNIWVKQRYLACLLDKNKWLEDEVSNPY